MTHDIQIQHYARLTRAAALQVLQKANLEPVRFTAHRDGTFTARYRRKTALSPESYEHRIEFASDHPIAIFKRPNKQIDRGPYTTLQFAFGKPTALPRKASAANGSANGTAAAHTIAAGDTVTSTVVPAQTLALLTTETRSIMQLAEEAERVFKAEQHDHLPVLLEELTRHAGQLAGLLQGLSPAADDLPDA